MPDVTDSTPRGDKPVPASVVAIRLDCLSQALEMTSNVDEALARARRFEAYVTGQAAE